MRKYRETRRGKTEKGDLMNIKVFIRVKREGHQDLGEEEKEGGSARKVYLTRSERRHASERTSLQLALGQANFVQVQQRKIHF